MLRVTIEIWPGGDRARAHAIAIADVINISELSEVSDYAVSDAEQYNPIAQTPAWSCEGNIIKHTRRTSVWALVAKVAVWAAEEATKTKRE
jgi:hypothetical protein